MDFARILIMDLDPSLCPEDHSERLASLLRRFLPTYTLDVHTATHVPSETTSPPPDLILLRPPLTENLAEIVRVLRRRWSPVPAGILGLFCDGKDRSAAVFPSFLNNLEDSR